MAGHRLYAHRLRRTLLAVGGRAGASRPLPPQLRRRIHLPARGLHRDADAHSLGQGFRQGLHPHRLRPGQPHDADATAPFAPAHGQARLGGRLQALGAEQRGAGRRGTPVGDAVLRAYGQRRGPAALRRQHAAGRAGFRCRGHGIPAVPPRRPARQSPGAARPESPAQPQHRPGPQARDARPRDGHRRHGATTAPARRAACRR